MTLRPIVLMLGAAALMQPPVAVEARVLTVRACGGAAHRMLLPGDPADPAEQRDCTKACHAVTERRGKSVGSKRCC
jgi:hypothetical protein